MPMLPPVINIGRNDEYKAGDVGPVYMFNPELLSRDVVGEVPSGYVIRPLMIQDYGNGYLDLLGQLTTVGDVTRNEFEDRFRIMSNCTPQSYYIVVIEDLGNQRVVGTATLVIEWKFIHNAGCRGRVEDVVVDQNLRGKSMGAMLNKILVTLAKQVGVYKLSLECKDSLIPFYERYGYKKDNQNHFLVQRFDSNA